MGFLEKLKRRLGMAKRFQGGIKEDIVEEVDEIAERVAEEEIEEMIMKEEVEHTHDGGTTHSHVDGDKKHTHESKKLKKEEFLISKGLHDRPNSHLAMKAYEEYCETSKSGIR